MHDTHYIDTMCKCYKMKLQKRVFFVCILDSRCDRPWKTTLSLLRFDVIFMSLNGLTGTQHVNVTLDNKTFRCYFLHIQTKSISSFGLWFLWCRDRAKDLFDSLSKRKQLLANLPTNLTLIIRLDFAFPRNHTYDCTKAIIVQLEFIFRPYANVVKCCCKNSTQSMGWKGRFIAFYGKYIFVGYIYGLCFGRVVATSYSNV